MFDVVTCGFAAAALPSHPAHATVRRLPAPEAATFLEEGHDLLSARSGDRPVLFVHAASRSSRRRVATLRATSRAATAAVGFTRPSTGLAGVATWLASLASYDVPVGLATGHTLDRHAGLLPTYVVTSSVAGVDLPVVRLSHHLLSWLPGTWFTVALDTDPRVTTGSLTAPLPQAEGTDLVVCGAERLADRLAGVTPLDVVDRVEVEASPVATISWGRARFLEHTLVPRGVDLALEEIRGRSITRCATCGDEALGGACPFCSAREGVYA
jgi:hypothetical protein